MKIIITCWPTYGGSSVVATELGMALARNGDEVHFVTYRVPSRLDLSLPRVYYHEVSIPDYPLFEYPIYSLALASHLSCVAHNTGAELIHAHYAIPNAVSALLAKEMLDHKIKVVTTLHGTDITLIGQNPALFPVVRYAIARSDGVSVVSQFLRNEVNSIFSERSDILVIPNFLDQRDFQGLDRSGMRAKLAPKGEKLLVHISNFRPIKRVEDVAEIFLRVRKEIPCRLILIGSGPQLNHIVARAEEENAASDLVICGQIDRVEPILAACDVLLLPSQTESFGLVALEAMGCGVPVVATRVGGLPEVVEDRITGYLEEVGDVKAMTERVMELLTDPERQQKMGEASQKRAFSLFSLERILPQYRHLYNQVLNRSQSSAP